MNPKNLSGLLFARAARAVAVAAGVIGVVATFMSGLCQAQGAGPAPAAAVTSAPVPAASDPLAFAFDRERFGPYEDNYLLYQKMRNNGWAADDEGALRAHYSFRYGANFDLSTDPGKAQRQVEAFLSYTGEFDFYMKTRPSSPVINRLSNPALHVRFPAQLLFDGVNTENRIDVGLEHRSNGQVTEVTGADAAAAQAAYASQNRPFFDQISRGSNYVSLGAEVLRPLGQTPLFLKAKAKFYISKSSDVTWGPLAGQGVSIADYDRLSLLARYVTQDFGAFEVNWTVGDRGLKTDSIELGWQTQKRAGFPLYVRLHSGPMNTLSNYTQRQDSIGVGLRFSYFGE